MTTKSRARITSLVIINWHGFFFQRFEMDRGVTALEGENGAGKTTVMIAAFVALLPDQRLLQFRNVSEAGGIESDRGIFGRLGTRGAAYSVLELSAPRGGRILAGVMLRRKTPPSIEITPFIIEGITHEASLEQILLVWDGETARVPELADLRQTVGPLAGKVTVFDSVGQYTSNLFDLGVTPMRMEAYAERDKFNRMLQTSMYGGLSSSIQKGLRDYLLAEDPSLRNHVARMRENLETCRVTRQEIDAADKKYKSIQGVFRSGYGMFEAAFHGTRLRVAALRKKADTSRTDHRRCKSELDRVQKQWRDFEHRYAEARTELEIRQVDYGKAEERWRACKHAREIALEIDRHTVTCLEAKETREQSERHFRSQQKCFRECEWKRDQLLAEMEQNAMGLADAQKAWEHVSRKVALYRQAREALDDARTALPEREVTDLSVADLLQECREQWSRALESKTEIEREIESLGTRLRRYQDVLEALHQASQKDVAPEHALETARELDLEFREMARRIEEADALPARIDEAKKLRDRQQEVRRRVALIAGRGEKIESAVSLRSLFESRHKERDHLADERTSLQERLAALGEERALAEQRLERLQAEAVEWREARRLAQELEARFETVVPDGETLESLKQQIEADLAASGDRLRRLGEECETAQNQALELEFGGGRLDESLVRLRDLVDGSLAAELFDQTPEKQAPMVEARLGPLHGAILVEDIPEAAARIAHEPDRPDEVWLMEAGALQKLPEGVSYPAAELVKMGEAWRLTRHPERPVVGRAAREREIHRLKTRAEALLAEIEGARVKAVELRDALKISEALSRYWRFLGTPDPTEATNRLQNRLQEVQDEELRSRRHIQEIDLRLQHYRDLLQELTPCLPHANLLDDADWLEALTALQHQQKEVGLLKLRVEALQPAIARVRAGWLDLEYPPPRPEVVQTCRQALERAETVLVYWSKGRELLSTLVDRLPHFAYHDQEELLVEQKSALEALKEQKDKVDQAFQAAKSEISQAERELEQAREAFNAMDARYKVLTQKIESLRQDLARTGEDGIQRSLDDAEEAKADAKRKFEAIQQTERELNNDLIRAEKDVESSRNRTADTRERRKGDLEDLWPHWRNWMLLKRRALREGLAERLLEPQVVRSYDQKGPPRAFEEASEHQGELKRILQTVLRGEDLWQEVIQPPGAPTTETRRGAQTLEAWLTIRRFLEQSIPRDIAQADDPEVALKQIEDHLQRLNGRLIDQERQLRQRTDTVANSILTRIRREDHQIHRLNRGLEAVSFGTIAGIRIRLERVESMQRLLDGLKMQKDLFSAHVSLEEAMTELYRQVGGGQVRGDQLLDYREYVRMSVEVQRLGTEKWARVFSNTLSTGESIGVGAAVLMVILDAWEHQAVLLRGKRDGGSLRFLFLDEAARLSPRSLDTLGELCERMDLQLLVAAPAADRARRGTAYRLVRQLGEDGSEEVVVRGRRFTGQTTEA
jgi:chromosome partition protein MukB